ncbi:MAG: DNA adenine methylase [Gemmataceae bacterium]
MSTLVPQPLKWHGGKNYLAANIIELFPPRCRTPNKPAPGDSGWLHYVEPYAGGLAVLLANDPEGISEVVNDRNEQLTNFWRVLQQPAQFEIFLRLCEATPLSELEYRRASAELPDPRDEPVQAAWAFFVRCRQSLAGRMKGFTGVTKTRTRRGMNNDVSAWLTAVEGLPQVHARLKRVLILNRPALEVLRGHDGPHTLFYLDPPYVHETRATTGEYDHEMTAEEHRALLTVLSELKGRFLLSGYRSALYDDVAAERGWRRHDFELPNQAASGPKKRRMVECVWTNI